MTPATILSISSTHAPCFRKYLAESQASVSNYLPITCRFTCRLTQGCRLFLYSDTVSNCTKQGKSETRVCKEEQMRSMWDSIETLHLARDRCAAKSSRVWNSQRQMMSSLPGERGQLWAASSFEGFRRRSSNFRNQWPMTAFLAGYGSIFLEERSRESAT